MRWAVAIFAVVVALCSAGASGVEERWRAVEGVSRRVVVVVDEAVVGYGNSLEEGIERALVRVEIEHIEGAHWDLHVRRVGHLNIIERQSKRQVFYHNSLTRMCSCRNWLWLLDLLLLWLLRKSREWKICRFCRRKLIRHVLLRNLDEWYNTRGGLVIEPNFSKYLHIPCPSSRTNQSSRSEKRERNEK